MADKHTPSPPLLTLTVPGRPPPVSDTPAPRLGRTALRYEQLTLCRSRQHTPVAVQPWFIPGLLRGSETVKSGCYRAVSAEGNWLSCPQAEPEPAAQPFSTSALGS